MGWNIGGINATGQVPEIPGMPQLVDKDTPDEAKIIKGPDGRDFALVFSDEFNTDGRTFWPGDDPFWEGKPSFFDFSPLILHKGQDLNYWGTHNYEWFVFWLGQKPF